jgi:hypothetical protein
MKWREGMSSVLDGVRVIIKSDNPMRGGYVSSHNDVNRGKRSLLLDLKSAAGRVTHIHGDPQCRTR